MALIDFYKLNKAKEKGLQIKSKRSGFTEKLSILYMKGSLVLFHLHMVKNMILTKLPKQTLKQQNLPSTDYK